MTILIVKILCEYPNHWKLINELYPFPYPWSRYDAVKIVLWSQKFFHAEFNIDDEEFITLLKLKYEVISCE